MAIGADEIRKMLKGRLAEAVLGGPRFMEINSGEFGRALGIYPTPNRMPNLCRVLREEMRANDWIVSKTADGYDGPRLTIRFGLPR